MKTTCLALPQMVQVSLVCMLVLARKKKNEIVKVKKNAVNFNLGNIYNMRAEDIYITFYKVGF